MPNISTTINHKARLHGSRFREARMRDDALTRTLSRRDATRRRRDVDEEFLPTTARVTCYRCNVLSDELVRLSGAFVANVHADWHSSDELSLTS